MRVVLICSAGSRLNREVMPAFLASTLDLVGIVEIEERPADFASRLKHQWRRSRLRMVDALAFRLYYRFRLARHDLIDEYVATKLAALPPLPNVRLLTTHKVNSPETAAFIASLEPDICVAACKSILRRDIFDIPRHGTFVVHPGILPEYRNAHGCFWALARRDLKRVGATLLRIDEGVDTGPVYAYYTTDYDERTESHVVIQRRVVYENLDAIARDLRRIREGSLQPIDTTGRTSATWGQPYLTTYLRWKRAATRATQG